MAKYSATPISTTDGHGFGFLGGSTYDDLGQKAFRDADFRRGVLEAAAKQPPHPDRVWIWSGEHRLSDPASDGGTWEHMDFRALVSRMVGVAGAQSDQSRA